MKLFLSAAVLLFLAMTPAVMTAQTAGEGTIQGTVTDGTGAAVPNATVTATNVGTNVTTVRTSTAAGLYNISPLPPGRYKVKIEASGFKTMEQSNLVVNALQVLTFNPALAIGETSETVMVTAAPPILNQSNATLGLTIENETYSNLPLQMNNAQRDPTSFGSLTPGAQGGSRLPVIGGTGNYLGQLYLDGMPAQTVSQQGDNRLVGQAVSVEAVDQFQIVTSTPPAEYSGAGAENFTMKSGTLKYHGQVSDFVRNTIFDAWSFTSKAATVKNSSGETVQAPKPVEHQNELSLSFGGPIPFTRKKGFFFVAYDKFHSRRGVNPSLFTVPTAQMRAGDFSQLGADPFLYDPTSTTCSGGTCTRTPFQGLKNGVPTYNVIPDSYLSPISQKMQSFLPDPSNDSLVNNYFGGRASGFDNRVIDWRVDYDVSARQRISTIGAMGSVNYVNNYSSPYLPLPYTGGDLAQISPKVFDVEDTYTFSPRLVNQLKYGYTRFFQNIQNATQGITQYEAGTMGITNLPAGQAGEEFPGAAFGATGKYAAAAPITQWTSNSNAASTQLTTPNNYALVDNLQWTKGRHAITLGISIQWQQINNSNPATYTGVLSLAYNPYSTANFSGNALTTNTGYSYASYLLGAVGGTPSIGLQPISELGGRYRPIAPYIEDSFKVNSKLTLNLGLRWDYLPPYREVKDHWTFMNPDLTNAITGTPGMLQFAGNYGGPGVSCGCRTPVKTYWKNWGPRIGLAYSVNDKTVIRAGFATVYSQGGGVGGRGGAFQGTGQTGFNMTATGPDEITSGAAANPSFYLNNGPYFSSIGQANTSLFGAGYAYPSAPTPGVAAQVLNTGNYLDGSGKFVTANSVAYADPYYSGRAPQFIFYNFGFERSITPDMTLGVNYVGNQSHFLINSTTSGSNPRGYWTNQLDPAYLASLGGVTDSTGKLPILDAPATPSNVAKAMAAVPGLSIPAFFQNAAAVKNTATISQGLVAFPQYKSISDTWGANVGNFSYNSLQIVLQQRLAHGLTFNVNYTYSKNIGDDGTFRSGFNIPAAALSGGTKDWHQNRIDRSWTRISTPQSLHAFGVWKLPFGRNGIGANSWLVRNLAGGWQFSGIYTYSSGTPVAVVSSQCTTGFGSSATLPGQGQCMPDINTSFNSKSARINGSYGSGPGGFTAANLGKVPYIDKGAFATPKTVSAPGTSVVQYLIGNAPRTRAWNLNNPGTYNIDAALRRSFELPKSMSIELEADCLNVTNKVTFGSPNATFGNSAFGTISSASSNARDFQFAGHFKF